MAQFLTSEQREKNMADILALWSSVNRRGVDDFLKWLTDPKKSDFFTAPASTKYHGAYQGGLAQHSLDVYYRLLHNVAKEQAFARSFDISRPADYVDGITKENVIVTALTHDLCKVHFYKWDTKNKKQPDGSWDQVPFITIEEEFPFGHGEKSVYIAQSFFRLTREEAIAIRYHMGDYANDKNTSRPHENYPLAALLHIADVEATYLTDRRSGN